MGFDAIKKGLLVSIRWVRDYPFILGLVIFFFLVNRFVPSAFSFLLSFSPIFVCTGVLLQFFFSFGQRNVYNDQKGKDNNVSAEAPSRSRRRRDVKKKIESFDYCSHPAPSSLDDSNDVSECSLISNDGSCEMEDEVGSGEGGVKPVEWTEDDEKNLMDLGSSELERNQRLESLIAKRRARKLSRMVAQKDLIDFGNHELPQIPAVTTKRNDSLLDLPYNPHDASEFSPIPCSAPSVLLPTRNPFDLPYGPFEEKPNLTEDSFQEEFMWIQQKDVHFCRHESFCFGPTFMEPKQEKRNIKFTPFFVTESTASQNVMGGGYPSSPEATNDSVVSSASEPKPLPSPVADLGDQKMFIRQESQASDEGSTSKDIGLEENNRDVLKVEEIPGVDKEITHEMDSNLIPVDTGEAYVKPEAPIKYEGLSPSPSPEEDHVKREKLENLSCKIGGGTDNNQSEELHYDLSPSAVDKETINDTLFYVDKGVILTTASSIASDLQVEVSQAGSPPALLDKTFSLTDWDSLANGVEGVKQSSSGNEVPNDAFSDPNDHENELTLNKATKDSELEPARARLSGDNVDQVAPHVVVEQVSSDSLLNSAAVEQVPIGTGSVFPPMDQVPLSISDPVVEQVSSDLLNSIAIEEVSIGTGSSSFPPNQVLSPMSDPNFQLEEEKADHEAGKSSDASSLEGLIHPYKGEVSSGSEVPNGVASHNSDNKNESSGELETIEDGLSGGSDEPAAQNVVLESMVLEHVSSHSMPESVAVEKVSTDTSPYSLPMDQVPLPVSDPNILLDKREKTDQVTGNPSNGSSRVNLIPPFIGEGRSGNEVPNGADQVGGNSSLGSSHEDIIHHFKGEVSSGNEAPNGASSPSVPESAAVEKVSTDTSPYSLPMDQAPLPMSDPNILPDKREKTDQVTANSSNGSSHENIGEGRSGNEVPNGAFSHHSDNELRSKKVTQSSQLETTEDGLSGGSDESATPNVVLESTLVEKISSLSVPESVGVKIILTDSSSYSPPMDQVHLPISDPKITFDEEEKADPVCCNSSDAMSHEGLTSLTTGKPEPPVEEQIAQPRPGGVHEEAQMQFLIEKSFLNGEEHQEQPTIPVNFMEKTNVMASKSEPVVCQDQTEGKQKSMPSETNEGNSALASMVF